MQTWEQYFISIAKQVATRSKDPSSKVGCVIVDHTNKPISFGFNGFVSGCDESFMTFERPLKYHLIIHAEANAMAFAERRNLYGCKAFITHGPCENCLKHMLQQGIRNIFYADAGIIRDRGTPEQKEAIKLLIMATGADVNNVNTGISYEKEIYQPLRGIL